MTKDIPIVIENYGYKGSLHYKHLLIDPTDDLETIQYWSKRCKFTNTPFVIVQYKSQLKAIITQSGTLNGADYV